MKPRTAVVTGGTGGLGRAVTGALLVQGWRVVVPWLVAVECDGIEQHDRLELVEADLFDPESVAEVLKAAGEGDAPLGAVVNLVGGYAGGSNVHETPIEQFDQMLKLNLRPTYLVTQAALPQLIAAGGGSIVCVSSRAAKQPFAGAAGYIVGKAAVLAFVHAVAAEYRDHGVRCNAILPSVIDTPGNRAAMPDADHAKWVVPAEIAAAISFLCSDAASEISGAELPVYGRA